MRSLAATGTAFASAFMVILVGLFISQWLGLRQLQLWVAVCIAAGCALAFGAKAQWQLSRGAGSVLVGVLVGVGYVIGTWLSAHA